MVSEFFDVVASSPPEIVYLIISEKFSLFAYGDTDLALIRHEIRVGYGPDFKYKIVKYERMNEK